MKRRHNGIEYLRLLACISVILCHIPSNYGKISNTFGVYLFCLISGFMTSKTFVYDKKYLLKKIINLAPLYYFLTIVVYVIALLRPELVNSVDPSFSKLILSLLFIPFIQNGGTGYAYAIYPLGWYMILQMWFYVIYYLFALIFKDNSDKCLISMSAVLLAIVKIFNLENTAFGLFSPYYFYMIIGILLCNLFDYFGFNILEKNMYLPQTAIFTLCIYFFNKVENHVNIIFILIVFIFSYLFDSDENKLKKLSSSTYEIFLTHYFVVMAFSRLLTKIIKIEEANIGVQIIIVALSLTVGYLFSIINKIVTKRLKKILIK